jgi:hypothetical protein
VVQAGAVILAAGKVGVAGRIPFPAPFVPAGVARKTAHDPGFSYLLPAICRLLGIDAPEIAHGTKPGQPFGEEARGYLDHLIGGKTVRMDA